MLFSIRLNDRESEEEDNFENAKSGLKTLNLRLDEVAHIRAALTKAELEGIDGNLRNDIERGKVSNPWGLLNDVIVLKYPHIEKWIAIPKLVYFKGMFIYANYTCVFHIVVGLQRAYIGWTVN